MNGTTRFCSLSFGDRLQQHETTGDQLKIHTWRVAGQVEQFSVIPMKIQSSETLMGQETGRPI